MGEWENFAPSLPLSRSPALEFTTHDCREVVVAFRAQQRVLDDGAGGDDANHIPLDEPLDLFRIFELLDERDLVALVNQLGNVRLNVMVRHAGHR